MGSPAKHRPGNESHWEQKNQALYWDTEAKSSLRWRPPQRAPMEGEGRGHW